MRIDLDLPAPLEPFVEHLKSSRRFRDVDEIVVEALHQFRLREEPKEAPTIEELWCNPDVSAWEDALRRYCAFVRPGNARVERRMERLDRGEVESFDAEAWCGFLRDEYFPWKFTASNRLATSRRYLVECIERPEGRGELEAIRLELLEIDPTPIERALTTAMKIPGLGVAGGSGLLSVLDGEHFGTVDQFAVKALQSVGCLEGDDADAVAKMKPENLSVKNGARLIKIFRDRADSLNQLFGSQRWSPRMIDMVLWTYGRG